jgi:hypothetical protein
MSDLLLWPAVSIRAGWVNLIVAVQRLYSRRIKLNPDQVLSLPCPLAWVPNLS